MSRVMLEADVYTALALRDPWEYARQKMRENLEAAPADNPRYAVQAVARRTGRTTRMLVTLLAAMSRGRRVEVRHVDPRTARDLKQKLTGWAVEVGVEPRFSDGEWSGEWCSLIGEDLGSTGGARILELVPYIGEEDS